METNQDVLDLVFKKAEGLEFEISEDGIVTILEKQDHKIQRFFRKLGFRIPEYKRLKLDKYASFTFLQINGERRVEEIAQNIKEHFGDEAEPLYERLLLFLNHIDTNCSYIQKNNI